MRRRVWIYLAALVVGVFLLWGGEWLCWDWVNSIVVKQPWFDWELFCEKWYFPAPFWLYVWYCDQWTVPFDLAKSMMDAGGFVIAVAAFLLGYETKVEIEKLLERLWTRSSREG